MYPADPLLILSPAFISFLFFEHLRILSNSTNNLFRSAKTRQLVQKREEWEQKNARNEQKNELRIGLSVPLLARKMREESCSLSFSTAEGNIT